MKNLAETYVKILKLEGHKEIKVENGIITLILSDTHAFAGRKAIYHYRLDLFELIDEPWPENVKKQMYEILK